MTSGRPITGIFFLYSGACLNLQLSHTATLYLGVPINILIHALLGLAWPGQLIEVGERKKLIALVRRAGLCVGRRTERLI